MTKSPSAEEVLAAMGDLPNHARQDTVDAQRKCQHDFRPLPSDYELPSPILFMLYCPKCGMTMEVLYTRKS